MLATLSTGMTANLFVFSAGKRKQEEKLFAGMLRGLFFVRLKTVKSEYNGSPPPPQKKGATKIYLWGKTKTQALRFVLIPLH